MSHRRPMSMHYMRLIFHGDVPPEDRQRILREHDLEVYGSDVPEIQVVELCRGPVLAIQDQLSSLKEVKEAQFLMFKNDAVCV